MYLLKGDSIKQIKASRIILQRVNFAIYIHGGKVVAQEKCLFRNKLAL